MIKKLSLRWLFIGSIFVALSFYGLWTQLALAQAIPATELNGYAWSETIGWISLNCKTGGATGNDICASRNYKVSLNSDRTLTGYAWSENIGWVRFGGLSGFPTGSGTFAVQAQVVGTYPNLTFRGWARACAGDYMDPTTCTPSGVSPTTDEINWMLTGTAAPFFTQPIGAANSSNVVYGNGLYVAFRGPATVGDIDLHSSPDGITWTPRATPNGIWQALAFGNGMFVGVKDNGAQRIMTSPDGITWTGRAYPSGGDRAWKSVTFGGGQFVAVSCGVGTSCNTNSGGRIMTSPDGITWTMQSSPSNKIWNAVTYGNGKYVAVSESVGPNNVMTSPDGITWTAGTMPDGFWSDIEYGNGVFVATGWTLNGNVAVSADGVTWATHTVPDADGFESLVFGDGYFVASWYDGSNVGVSVSTDGATWNKQTFFDTEPMSLALYSLGFGNNTYIAGAPNGRTYVGRPLSLNGWDGWISLAGTGYSVSANSTGMVANSYAWGSDVVGWVDMFTYVYITLNSAAATISGTGCQIAAGASTCNGTFTWNFTNTTSQNVRNNATGASYGTAMSATNASHPIQYGNNLIQAREGSTVLGTATVSASCAAGSTYNGTICELDANDPPTISISIDPSIVRYNQTATVDWTIIDLLDGSCSVTGPGTNQTGITSSGSVTSGPLTSYSTFVIECVGTYGTVSEEAYVEVIPRAQEI